MRIELFEIGNEIIAIPCNQIVSITWNEDSLILLIECTNLMHSFEFETAEKGLQRFDEIVENIRCL